jgi:hypothetical protein
VRCRSPASDPDAAVADTRGAELSIAEVHGEWRVAFVGVPDAQLMVERAPVLLGVECQDRRKALEYLVHLDEMENERVMRRPSPSQA